MGPFILNILVPFSSILLLVFLLIYTNLQKPSEMQKHIITLVISTILFLFGYLIRVVSVSMEMATVGSYITYMGQPFILLSAFMLISTFYGYKIHKWTYVAQSLLAISVPVVVLTNQYHHLFYTTSYFDKNAVYSPLVSTHGPLYNANLLIVLSYFIAYNVLIIVGNKRSNSPIKHRLSVYSILMLFSGVLGYVIYFLDLAGGYDTTIIGIFFSTVFLSILFFRCKIFDIVDKSKDYALENSENGLVIYDDSNHIVYENKSAKQMVENVISESYVEKLHEGENRFSRDNIHYSIVVNNIKHRGDYVGKSVEIFNISDEVNHQKELQNAVEKTTNHLETIQRTIFGAMASIVEARSLETGDHIKHVSYYTEQIAQALRKNTKYASVLTDKYINMLVLASPLHDIGKISIPDSILLKPGSLTDEEYEIMKTHASKGADIIRTTMEGLESEEYIAMAANCSEYHHERWDGTGYPLGLKGDTIPLCARIIAVADCYDALTSERCYKKAMSPEDAINLIEQESGSHFDPDIVEALIKG